MISRLIGRLSESLPLFGIDLVLILTHNRDKSSGVVLTIFFALCQTHRRRGSICDIASKNLDDLWVIINMVQHLNWLRRFVWGEIPESKLERKLLLKIDWFILSYCCLMVSEWCSRATIHHQTHTSTLQYFTNCKLSFQDSLSYIYLRVEPEIFSSGVSAHYH